MNKHDAWERLEKISKLKSARQRFIRLKAIISDFESRGESFNLFLGLYHLSTQLIANQLFREARAVQSRITSLSFEAPFDVPADKVQYAWLQSIDCLAASTRPSLNEIWGVFSAAQT
jgi:hypothetical protein